MRHRRQGSMMGSPPASERSAGSPVQRPAFLGGLGESSGNVLGVGSPGRRRRQECELDPLRGGSRAVVSGLDDRPDCWVQRYQNRLRNSGTVRYSSDTTRTTEIDKLARPGMGGRLRLGARRAVLDRPVGPIPTIAKAPVGSIACCKQHSEPIARGKHDDETPDRRGLLDLHCLHHCSGHRCWFPCARRRFGACGVQRRQPASPDMRGDRRRSAFDRSGATARQRHADDWRGRPYRFGRLFTASPYRGCGLHPDRVHG